MRHEPWMNRDERSPEQIRQDRLRNLRHEERELMDRIETIRTEIYKLMK